METTPDESTTVSYEGRRKNIFNFGDFFAEKSPSGFLVPGLEMMAASVSLIKVRSSLHI